MRVQRMYKKCNRYIGVNIIYRMWVTILYVKISIIMFDMRSVLIVWEVHLLYKKAFKYYRISKLVNLEVKNSVLPIY